MSKLLDSLTQIHRKINAAEIETGIIGMLDPTTGLYTVEAPGRPTGYILVRLLTGQDSGTIQAALNIGVAPAYNTQVRLQRDPKLGDYVVTQVDPMFLLANPTLAPANVPPHRHYIGSGLDDPVEIRRLIPGRVWSFSGVLITIDPFVYNWDNIEYYYPGVEDYDISAWIPTSGNIAYIKIGIDPATNLIYIASSTPVPRLTGITFTDLQGIVFTNKIALAGLKVYSGESRIKDTDFFDLRGLSSTQSVGGQTLLNSMGTDRHGQFMVDRRGNPGAMR